MKYLGAMTNCLMTTRSSEIIRKELKRIQNKNKISKHDITNYIYDTLISMSKVVNSMYWLSEDDKIELLDDLRGDMLENLELYL